MSSTGDVKVRLGKTRVAATEMPNPGCPGGYASVGRWGRRRRRRRWRIGGGVTSPLPQAISAVEAVNPSATHRICTLLLVRPFATVAVFEADDVVFAEIRARLHFDHVQRNLPGVLDAMTNADGNVGGLVFFEQERLIATRDASRARTTTQCSARW